MKTKSTAVSMVLCFMMMTDGAAWCENRAAIPPNGTLTDTLTGLVWLQDADCFGLQNWNQAMDSVANLKSDSCGLKDGSKAGWWRLPTKDELLSRLRNTSGFNNVQSSWYWSSTPSAAAHSIIARFLFICWSDKTSVAMETYYNYVWPVRGGH